MSDLFLLSEHQMARIEPSAEALVADAAMTAGPFARLRRTKELNPAFPQAEAGKCHIHMTRHSTGDDIRSKTSSQS